jgi:transposase
MQIIRLDIHRAFAEAVAWKDGKLSRLGRVIMRREALKEFTQQLSNSDIVVIEATGNAASVAAVIGPHVSRVVIANPEQVRLIAHAKIKTDKIDAGVLAQLYASGFSPEVWIADETTQALRRQVTRRKRAPALAAEEHHPVDLAPWGLLVHALPDSAPTARGGCRVEVRLRLQFSTIRNEPVTQIAP